MPNEEEIKLNLTGSIRDVANLQTNASQRPRQQNQASVISNLPAISNGYANNDQQFAKLMDVLAVMTNRIESAHRKTHSLLEQLQLSLVVRLESLYKEMHTLNTTINSVFKYQIDLQKQIDSNFTKITFRLSGFLGVFGENFRKSILRMQELVSSKTAAEAAEMALVRLLGNIKFLRGFIGYEAIEFKGRMKPMPLTFELYKTIMMTPYYFDTLFMNIKTLTIANNKIKQAYEKIVLSKMDIITRHLADMKNVLLTILTYRPVSTDNMRDVLKDVLKPYSTTTEELRKQLNLKKLERYAEQQVTGLKDLKVTFTKKIEDVLKSTMKVGTALFQIARYLLSPRSLFGKLFYGYLTYKAIAYVLGPIFANLFKHNEFVGAIVKTMSTATRIGLNMVGIKIPQNQSIGDYFKEKMLSALDIFWHKYALPSITKVVSVILAAYGMKNILIQGVFGGGLWGSQAFLKGLSKSQRAILASMEKAGANYAKNINAPAIVMSLTSGLLRTVGGILQSTGIFGVKEVGNVLFGFGRGVSRASRLRRRGSIPPKVQQTVQTMQADIVNNTVQNILDQTQKVITLPENTQPSNKFKSKILSSMQSITDVLLTGISKTFSGMKTIGRGIGTGISKTFSGMKTIGRGIIKDPLGTAGSVIGTAGKTVFGIIGKILPFAKGALMTLGPIGIGIAMTLPLFMEGISFFRNILLPKVFGGKNNIPSSLRDIVSGLIVKMVTGTISAVINFIKNIPNYVRITAKIGGEILGGIKDAIIEIFKWGWHAIKRKFTGQPIAEVAPIQTAASEVVVVQEQQEEQTNFYQSMIEQAKEQGKRMAMIAEYFKGGAFKTDIMELAQSMGKAVRSVFDALVGIFDFAKGQFGGFITSMGSTLGAFLSGLMGTDKAAGFLSDITQIAREKGYGTLAGILGRTRESVLDLANRSAQTQVSAANTFSESVGVFKESVDTLAYTINYRGLASIGAPNVINEPRIIKRNVEQINTIKSLATIGVAETFEAPEMSRAATVTKEQLKADITRQQLLKLYFGSQRITSKYGEIRVNSKGEISQHQGVDIGVKHGTSIYTPLAGKVSKAGWINGYGNTVIIDHPQENVRTLYGHLSKILVKSGQVVYPGYKIALSGSTGRSTGPHLHFEVRKLGSSDTINPMPFIDSILTKYLPDVNLADAQLKERAVTLNLVKPVKAQVDTMQSLQTKEVTTQVSTVGLGTSQAQQNNKQQPAGNNIVIVNSPTTNSSNVTSNNNQTKDDDHNTAFAWVTAPIFSHELGL